MLSHVAGAGQTRLYRLKMKPLRCCLSSDNTASKFDLIGSNHVRPKATTTLVLDSGPQVFNELSVVVNDAEITKFLLRKRHGHTVPVLGEFVEVHTPCHGVAR